MKLYLGLTVATYALLTALTTLVMQELSPRHTVFLLVCAMLWWGGVKLWQQPKAYGRAMSVVLGVLISLFLIRYLTPTSIKVWEVDNYLSFAFALGNILLVTVGIIGRRFGRIFMGVGFALVSPPILLCWGYYCSEGAWLNVEAVMALLQTNATEAWGYVTDRTGGAAIVMIMAYLALIWLSVWAAKGLALKKSRWYYLGAALFLVLNVVLLLRTQDNFLTSIYAETKTYQADYDEFAKVQAARQAHVADLPIISTGDPGLYVLVIGESQNRTRMSAYGYHEPTTPWLESRKNDPHLIMFNNAYSCHVQTVPALTYALTSQNQYNEVALEDAVTLIEAANAAGFKTVWLSNQVRYGSWGTPISVIADEAGSQDFINSHVGNTLDTDYYDGELLNRLPDIQPTDKALLVIHLMGNHISYHSRYPAEFERFFDGTQNSEYDNSMLYNDHVMEELVKKLMARPNFQGLIYFADHSEAVNYGMAHDPATFVFDMAYIPFYMIFSDAYMAAHATQIQQLKERRDAVFTNDLIYNVMLSIMGVRVREGEEVQNDLCSPDYDANPGRFLTLYGQRRIAEDSGAKPVS
ncbi:MAG: phosphoethanolamine transferase [Selenomonadaceae bacterium]|nr:phosphoethanolamine transferase [Selenomonadaceae bacterium]